MMAKVYNKLVRDRIPEIIRADGATPITRRLDDAEFGHELLRKLGEEAAELLAAEGDREKMISEMADNFEVTDAIVAHFGISEQEIRLRQVEKGRKRGLFQDRIFLESVEG